MLYHFLDIDNKYYAHVRRRLLPQRKENHINTMNINEPADVRVLLKKLWCHGQAVAPIQGLAYAFWAMSNSSGMSKEFKVLLWVAALKFPVWGLVSWQALNLKYGEKSFPILCVFGVVIVFLDILIAVIAVTSHELTNGWALLALIATALHGIETTAFLSAVCAFRGSLKATDGHGASYSPSSQSNSQRLSRMPILSSV